MVRKHHFVYKYGYKLVHVFLALDEGDIQLLKTYVSLMNINKIGHCKMGFWNDVFDVIALYRCNINTGSRLIQQVD
jgi:hypothetical protein